MGNPGIQGSNLVCRLNVLLEAGLFDESLPSCTDRDLCIRISELPGVCYGTFAHSTVLHFACRSRPRLSTRRSPSRLAGLDGFFRKYRGRMSDVERARFRTRARRLFEWKESLPERVTVSPSHQASPAPRARHSEPRPSGPHLVARLIADTDRLEEVRGLLADLGDRAGETGLSGMDVLVMENGAGRTANDSLSRRRAGLPAPRDRARASEAGGRRTPARRQHLRVRYRSAQARTQSLAGHRWATKPAIRHVVGATATTLLRQADQDRTDCALPRPFPRCRQRAGRRAHRG